MNELDRLLADAFVINGVSAIKVMKSKSIDTCVKASSRSGLNYVVLSDELSLYELNTALERLTSEKSTASMPIMIVGKKKDPKIYSLVVEYGVSEYYTGEILKDPIRKVVKSFMESTALTPKLGKHLEHISRHIKSNDLDQATRLYENILRDSTEPSHKIRLNLAELYFQMEKFDRAKKILSPLASSNRKDPKYYYLMARIAVKMNGMEEAAEYF